MSLVTNVIFTYSILEDNENLIKEVNKFFFSAPLISCDDYRRAPIGWYGGTKRLEARIFIGAFNCFIIKDFMKHIKGLKWQFPKYVQLIVQEEVDEQFRIIQMTGYKDD